MEILLHCNMIATVVIFIPLSLLLGLPGSASGKEPVCQCRRLKRCGFDPQEEGMATHSSILAWKIPWTEEPGGLQSMGSKELDTTEVT